MVSRTRGNVRRFRPRWGVGWAVPAGPSGRLDRHQFPQLERAFTRPLTSKPPGSWELALQWTGDARAMVAPADNTRAEPSRAGATTPGSFPHAGIRWPGPHAAGGENALQRRRRGLQYVLRPRCIAVDDGNTAFGQRDLARRRPPAGSLVAVTLARGRAGIGAGSLWSVAGFQSARRQRRIGPGLL